MTRVNVHSKALSSPLGSIDEEGDSILDEAILDDSRSSDMAAPHFDDQMFSTSDFLTQGDDTWQAFSNQRHESASSFQAINADPAAPYLHTFDAHDTHYPTLDDQSAPWEPIEYDGKSQLSLSDEPNAHCRVKSEGSQRTTEATKPTATRAKRNSVLPSMDSPQSENSWLSASSPSRSRKPLKREAISRPSFNTFPTHLRREYLDKKRNNARVEIPEGRTLESIEEELQQCDPTDDAKIKELKGYKRLLRNREAALSSRSRKKEHAQRLEQENKILAANLKKYHQMMRAREQYWAQETFQMSQFIEARAAEKEELVRSHTLETAELRKKINILVEEAQRTAQKPVPAVYSPTGFHHTTFADFEQPMNDNSGWKSLTFVNPSSVVDDGRPHSDSHLVRQRDAKNVVKDEDSRISSLLVMLLLCGAWVASGNNTKSNPVPQMPEDVRAASAQVLTNIYREAGLHQPEAAPSATSPYGNPAFAGPNPAQHSLNAYSAHFDPEALHNHLTAPSFQQESDQAFSLTPNQYNHITTDWFVTASQAEHQQQQQQSRRSSSSTTTTRRRNLADALANLHLDKRTTATKAYTKSLLMDEVPTDVVRDFHRMVAKNGAPDLTM